MSNDKHTLPAPDTLAMRVRAARQAADALNAETDRLNQVIADVEMALAELQLGVRAQLDLIDERSPGSCVLSFRKHEGKWCLLVEYPNDFAAAPVSLTKASRALRMQAAAALPKLVDVIVASVATQSEEIKGHVATLSLLATELREARP